MGVKARMPASAPLSRLLILAATCIIVSETINAQAHGAPLQSGAQGSGNIGCTFSPAVCDPDQEFCYNDNAFGRCVPLYGMPDESNFYRYSLTKADSHALEAVIERLTADGYRWNHAFTQCTLQHVLNAIRYGWEGEQRTQHDCSEARAEDDLNSMVKALGEGQDQGADPLDLAFIKYRPGDEYSEDLYLPAATQRERERQRTRPSQAEAEDANARRRLEEEKQLEAELENYILGGQEGTGAWNPSHRNKLERSELEEELEANQRGRGHPIQQQQEQEQEIEFIQPKIFSPIYNTPELLRQGIESRDELEFLPEDAVDGGDNVRDSNNNVPKIQAKLSPPGQEIVLPPKLQFFVDEHDALLQEPNTIAKQINKSPVTDTKLAKELKEYDELRDALLEAAAREEMLENQQQSPKVAPPFHRFSVPRKSIGEGGKMSLFAPDGSNDGVLFLNPNTNTGTNFEGRRHPVYLDTPNNGGGDGEDYAQDQDDREREAEFETAMFNGMVVDNHGGGPFERHERLDVKKPGPWYRSVNNFAFDDDDEDKQQRQLHGRENKETGWDFPVNPEFRRVGPIGILLPAAQQQQQQQHEASSPGEENSKNRENIESLLKLTERKTGGGSPAASPPKSSEIEALDIIDTSYINVVVEEQIGWNAARDLVNLLADLLDLKHSIFREVRVRGNLVTFKVEPNDKKLDAATIAHKIESFKSVVQKESDITIVKAEVGVRANPDSSASDPAALPLFDDGLTRNNNLYIATFALCGVVAAVVVAAFTLYFVRRNARSKEKFTKLGQEDPSMEACSKDYQDLCRARMASKNNEKPESHRAVQRVQSNISRDSDAGGTSSSRSSTSSWTEEPVLTNMDISTGHMVLSYMEDHLNNKSRLDQEWTALCAYEADPCSTTIAEKPDNAKKNRYTNSLPYDHSRVVLNELANVSGCDYINASSITDHDPRNPAYIATQGPLQTTCADFWQMVWEQGSVVIVTLTRLKDNGTTLCHRYWPEEGSELHHIYEVHLVSEHIWCEDYLVRSFYLKNLKTGETRTVTQFHFLAWPENGIPSSTKALLEFRRKVNKSYRGRSCPIIVHCSDGAGRTGTYCLIDMVLNRMSKGAKEIDIAASLEHIRDQRAGMVRTKQQFEFVLMAVAEEVHAILKALPQ